ncbi:MAG TPA: metallopeptidase family protein, partial [Deltaproteobacteria bacterium]|nr:metallopeptidase family protein [Deltaproteobacteria bacterium]
MNLNDAAFARIVRRAVDRIPDEIMRHVQNVAITVEDWPSEELLADMGLPPDEPLLGVYTGVALPERSLSSPEIFPDTIILFREPLLDICETVEELEEEIEITVV